jgi:hypothetical protein
MCHLVTVRLCNDDASTAEDMWLRIARDMQHERRVGKGLVNKGSQLTDKCHGVLFHHLFE